MPPSPPPPSTSEPISVLLDTASATANLSQSRTLLSQLETLRDSLSSRVDQLSSAVERLRVQAGELERALVDDTGPEASRSRTVSCHSFRSLTYRKPRQDRDRITQFRHPDRLLEQHVPFDLPRLPALEIREGSYHSVK